MKENSILIVSSDKEFSKLLVSYLEKKSKEIIIIECHDDKEALFIIQKHSPGLIIIEHSFTRLNTIDLINTIRVMLHYFVPIVVYTNIGDEELVIEVMLAGANDYLIKDKITRKQLASRLQKVITEYNNIKKIKQDLEKYKKIYLFDELTSLYNRSGLIKHLSKELAYAIRHKIPLTCFYLDIDRFKTVNDSLGHSAGDKVLREVAKRLKLSLREEDIIARFGGDEFVIICIGLSDKVRITSLATKILSILHKPYALGEKEVILSASLGIAFSHNKSKVNTIIDEADQALMKSKETKGIFTIYQP